MLDLIWGQALVFSFMNTIQRTAKITPKKKGLFVLLYKRIGNGPIIPYDSIDQFDSFTVRIEKSGHVGQFVFPKKTLEERGIISVNGQGGKRAIRVYPPWEIVESKQAKVTQQWQRPYYFTLESVEHSEG